MSRGRRARKGIGRQARPRLSPAHAVLTRAAPDVAARWLRDRAYLHEDGHPRRLRLRGAGPSLSRLILRVAPTGDVDEIATFLIRSGAVRKSGQYYALESRFVPFSANLGATFTYTAENIQRYLGTVMHNLSCSEPRDKRIERRSVNRNIPVRAAPKIHRYFRRQLGNLISRVDAYLQRQEVKPGSEPTVEIGLNIFAFEQSTTPPEDATSDDVSVQPNNQTMKPRRIRSKDRS